MKIRMTVLALLAVTVGMFAYTRTHNPIPSDLRDAVSDGAFDALENKSGVEASDVKVTEPAIKPTYVETSTKRDLEELLPDYKYAHDLLSAVSEEHERMQSAAELMSGEDEQLQRYYFKARLKARIWASVTKISLISRHDENDSDSLRDFGIANDVFVFLVEAKVKNSLPKSHIFKLNRQTLVKGPEELVKLGNDSRFGLERARAFIDLACKESARGENAAAFKTVIAPR